MPLLDLNSIQVQAQFNGVDWTDITGDIVIDSNIHFNYGISGHTPTDRLAKSGMLTFSLNNSATNSGSLLGYYTPNHINARSGFDLNLPVRIVLDAGAKWGDGWLWGDGTIYGVSAKVKFLGKVSLIEVIPGASRDRKTNVTAQDFVWEMSKHKMDLLATQESQRSDQMITTIIGNMTEAPEATSYATGQETFAFAADDLKDEKSTALAAAQKIVVSESGYLYVEGDGTLVFEDRHARVSSESLFTFDGTDLILEPAQHGFDKLYNHITAVAFPRDEGAANEVLWTLNDTPEIAAGATLTITGRYVDPDQKVSRISGKDLVTPLADTDFKFGSSEGGGSNDKNGDLDITATFGANSVKLALNNTSGSSGFVNLMQVRGIAIRRYEPVERISEDTASQATYGKREYTIQLPYQDDPLIAKDFSDTFLAQYKNPKFYVAKAGMIGNSDDRLRAMISLEPGDRITISDTVLELSNDYFVHSVDFTFLGNDVISAFWSLVEASAGQSWLLGQTGFSELGDTTILGT